MRTSPWVFFILPRMIRSKVVLPDPLGPSRPYIWPTGTLALMLVSTLCWWYLKLKLETCTAYWMSACRWLRFMVERSNWVHIDSLAKPGKTKWNEDIDWNVCSMFRKMISFSFHPLHCSCSGVKFTLNQLEVASLHSRSFCKYLLMHACNIWTSCERFKTIGHVMGEHLVNNNPWMFVFNSHDSERWIAMQGYGHG